MREQAQRTGRDLTRVVEDLAAGRPPATESLTTAIDRADKILVQEEHTNPLLLRDDKARQTVHDTHDFLEATKNLLVHKTGDNKLQTFLVDSLQASSVLTSKSSELLSAAGGEESEEVRQMRQHFALIVSNARKVLVELSTSREFRTFVTDFADIIARLLDIPVSFTSASAKAQGARAEDSKAQGARAEDSTAHLRATTAQTERLAADEKSRAGQGVAKVPLESLEESEDVAYEETDFEVHAARLGEMKLPSDYTPALPTDPTAQTFVTAERGGREEHYITAGRGPIVEQGDANAPRLRVVEKVYAPGQRIGERSTSSTTTASTASSISTESSAEGGRSAPMATASNVMSAVQQMWLERVDYEARQRLQADFFALLAKLAAHPDHKEAVESLFALAGLVWKQTPSVESLSMPPELRKATEEGKAVLGAFTGGEQNINRLIHHLQVFALRVQNDPEVERLLRKFGKYIVRGLDDPTLIQQAFFRQKIYSLLDRAGFLGERYAKDNDLKEAFLAWKLIIENISNDQDINAFGRSLLKLRDDISYIDPKGTRRIDFETLAHLRAVVLPLLVEQLHYLPLPAIAGDTPDLSYRMEDMVISFYDVLPEHIFIDTETHTDLKPMSDYEHEYIDKTLEAGHLFHDEGELGTRKAYNRHHAWGYFKGRQGKRKNRIRPRDKIAPHLTADKKSATYGSSVVSAPNTHLRSVGQLVIRAYNIQFDIKNMKFDVLRKKFPKVHAKGLADVHTKGTKGSKVVIRLDMAMDAYQANPFTGAAVSVKIAPLKVKIHNSKHDLFYTTMSNMVAGTIRKKAEAAIVERLQYGLRGFLETLNKVFTTTLGQVPGFRIAKPAPSSASQAASSVASAAIAPTKIVAQQ